MTETAQPSDNVHHPHDRAPSSPLQAWRTRWVVAVMVTVLGAALGVGAGSVLPPTYTAEARVAVGAGALSAGAAAGFPQASSELAASYSRYVNDLGLEKGVAVAASPIPDSSIIRIEAVANQPSTAVEVANATVKRLMSEVNTQTQGSALLKRYSTAAARSSEVEGKLDRVRSALDTLEAAGNGTTARAQRLRDQIVTLQTRAASLLLVRDGLGEEYSNRNEAVQAAGLRSIAEATMAVSDRPALVQRYGAIGAVVGVAFSLVLAVLLERRRQGGSRGLRVKAPRGL